MLFWTNAAGYTLPPLFIFPPEIKSQTADIAHSIVNYRSTTDPDPPVTPRIAFAESGYMNSPLFETELRLVLPQLRKRMPANELGLLIYDAHKTHVSRRVLEVAKWYGFHICTLPSHLSMTLQPLDVYFNGAFATEYQTAYRAMVVRERQPNASDKVQCVLKAFDICRTKKEQCINAWKRCGMPAGFPEPKYMKPKHFAAGISYRQELAQVTPEYLKILFSKENLIATTEDVISQTVLQQYSSRLEAKDKRRELAGEMVRMMLQKASATELNASPAQSSTGVAGLSMVLAKQSGGQKTPYFLPRILPTVAFTYELWMLNANSDEVDSTDTRRRSSNRFKRSIGIGTILTSQVMALHLTILDAETEEHQRNAERVGAHRTAQEPIWKSLLTKAISEGLARPTTQLSPRKNIAQKTLISWCKTRGLPCSGSQAVLANRLLLHFQLPGVVESLPRRVRDEGNLEEDDENDEEDEEATD